MDIFAIDKLRLFFFFFVPGFISVKIYDLMVPGERRDFSKDLLEVVAYSAINFAALSWLIFFINSNNFYANHKGWYYLFTFLVMFIIPLMWPFLFIKIASWPRIAKYILHPIPKPWDYVFGKRKSFWTIVHLKNGKRIGGIYSTKSFASSYPVKEQIYLEQVWKLDEKGAFVKAIDRSDGIVIIGDEIVAIEFFKTKEVFNGRQKEANREGY